jgi:WD40 repeat protein
MIRVQRITGGVLICMLLLLAGCNSRTEEELPHNKFSNKFAPLRTDSLDRLTEIDAWEIMENDEAISFVQHNLALNRLTVISDETHRAALFAIEREETIAQQVVDIPNLQVLGMDEDGEKLLVGRSGQRLNDLGEPQEYFHWIALWNILSGFLDKCFTGSCTGELTDPGQIAYAYIGAVVDDNTEVTYSEGSYLTTILSPEDGGGISLVNSPDADYWWHIGRMAVNSDQNRLAIVFQEGGITLRKIIETGIWPLAWTDVLVRGEENQLQPIQEAIFDPDGRWLAIVRGQDLIIWQVSGWKREVFREQIGNVHGMQFNPSGELLFIGRDNAINVVSLKERSMVFEMQAPSITSLDISDDNRLLFWGDERGTVHAWGIPVKK